MGSFPVLPSQIWGWGHSIAVPSPGHPGCSSPAGSVFSSREWWWFGEREERKGTFRLYFEISRLSFPCRFP